MQIIPRDRIESIVESLDLLPLIEAGFAAYSSGRSIVPPVGELLLDEGEVHIKYGAIRGDSYYVIKIASGFYGNSELGLPNGNGMMLVFAQDTGVPIAALLDEGWLTDVRTAVAGAVGAKYLAPRNVQAIGVLGSGVQARMQVRMLASVVDCRDVVVWGRTHERVVACARDLETSGFRVIAAEDPAEVAARCNFIVTTTPSTEPLLREADVREGTHINAIGSDTPHKQELDAGILARADLVVGDSLEQCATRGEISRAQTAGRFDRACAIELGRVISGEQPGRSEDAQITVFDSTGVAVQDIAIATAVVSRAVAD